jgi:hypothetical protein
MGSVAEHVVQKADRAVLLSIGWTSERADLERFQDGLAHVRRL